MGEMLVLSLAKLNAPSLLILAVLEGRITKLECAMEKCRCPEGRAHFERKGDRRRGPWAPSADRWPVPGRDGGQYTSANIRLAHASCNCAEGGRWSGLWADRTAENNSRTRVTRVAALEMRALLATNEDLTYDEIASQFGVATDTVKRVAWGVHWSVKGLAKITRLAKGRPFATSAWASERRGPGFESKRREAMAAFWHSPAGETERANRAERARKQWSDPAVRSAREQPRSEDSKSKMRAGWTPERRAAHAEQMRRQWHEPGLRRRRLSGIQPATAQDDV